MTYSTVVSLENIGDRYRVDLMDGDTTVNTFYCDVNDFDVTMVIVGGIVPFIASSGFTDMSVSNETCWFSTDSANCVDRSIPLSDALVF